MSDNERRFARSSSNQESFRPGQIYAASKRGATSPSNISSSSDDDGGAPLNSRLASVSLSDISSKAAMYASKDPKEKALSTTSTKFQIGGNPDDGDVFGAPVAAAPMNMLAEKHGSDHGQTDFSTTQVYDKDMDPRYTGGIQHTSDYSTPVREADYNAGPGPMVPQTRSANALGRYQVGGVDAQSFYPPGACVFVANLPEGVDDTRLEAEVTRHFSRFGTVFVKIRRDARNMPFAFCQYTKENDAQGALVQGKGVLIHGRACRTEMVRANRTYIIHRFDGDDLDVEEARSALEDAGLGAMNKCVELPYDAQCALGMNKAVLFELQKFDPAKEVQSAFRHHPRYRVMAYDPKKASQVAKVEADEAWLQRYDTDRRSVFIGDLPDVKEDLERELRKKAETIGDVLSVQVIRKSTQDGRPPSVFAFIEFARPDMADMAVERMTGIKLYGEEIRVERKAPRDPVRSSRRMQFEPAGRESYRSPLSNYGSHRRGYGSGYPETPLRSRGGYNSRPRLEHNSPATAYDPTVAPFVATPGHAQQQWSSFQNQGVVSPSNYTTSPYVGFNGSYSGGFGGNYTGGTPQAHAAMANMSTPYGFYPANGMNWATPHPNNQGFSPYYPQGHGSATAYGGGKTSGRRGRDSGDEDSGAGPKGGHAA